MRLRRVVLGAAAVLLLLAGVAWSVTTASAARAATASAVAVGWDTYRQLDRLPYLTAGVTTAQQSSFDRTGGNADYSHVLATASDGTVIAQHQGPGEVDSIWTTGNLPGAGNLKVVLDGRTIVDAPLSSILNGDLGAPFTYPLVADDTQSSGGHVITVPMPFRQSMRISTTADPKYYHVTYRTFPDATGITTFSRSDPADDVLTTLQEAGTRDPKPAAAGATTRSNTYQVMPGQSATVAEATGSGEVTALRLQIPHLIHPATAPLNDDGRAFGSGGSSTFTVSLDPANTGIRVTRRYDPEIGNQKATLLVDGAQVAVWNPVPAVGGGPWADQTVSVPASATGGRSQVTINNVFASSDKDVNEFTYTIAQQVGGVWVDGDTVDVGPRHTAAEAAHHYRITGQTWSGVRSFSYPLPGRDADTGRAFGSGGSSTFTVAIDPANTGVQLVRRLDPAIKAQVAAVSVDGVAVGDWVANPAEPAGAWLDETIELPASATAGKSHITVTNRFVSSGQDFNEFTYWANSHLPNGLQRGDTVDVGDAASESGHGYAIAGQTWSGTRTYSYPHSDAAMTGARIRITFDGNQTVDTPLGRFFGAANGLFDVHSLMTAVDTRPDGWLSSWWPMPYGRSVSVSLYNGTGLPLTGSVALTTASDAHWQNDLTAGTVGYFRAASQSGSTTTGQDWTFLHATGHGKVVGVVHGMTGATSRLYLEGDERVFTDGSASPRMHGTGTEDFYEGGFYFAAGPFSNPLTGSSSHETGAGDCPANHDCTAAYRLLLADAVGFDSSITFNIEHGGTDGVGDAATEAAEAGTYYSTAFWYGNDAAIAHQTDTLTMGDATSEAAHHYTTAAPGDVTTLSASYEGSDGPKQLISHTARATTAAVTFTLTVDPNNRGVRLQRTSDQKIGYQSAEISVDGTDLGQWLQPLANPYHRWLDDEYTLPAAVTAGKSQITVTLTPTSGSPSWSAASYRAVSLVT